MGYFDRVATGRIDRFCDVVHMLKSILVADGMHSVPEGHVLNVDAFGFGGRRHGDTFIWASRSAVLIAALVMMSRLPAYAGR